MTTCLAIRQIESTFWFIFAWVPFYSWIRLGLHVYLLFPALSGAVNLYWVHVQPFLHEHDEKINQVISDTWAYVHRVVPVDTILSLWEYVKTRVLNLPPTAPLPVRPQDERRSDWLFSQFVYPYPSRPYPSGSTGPGTGPGAPAPPGPNWNNLAAAASWVLGSFGGAAAGGASQPGPSASSAGGGPLPGRGSAFSFLGRGGAVEPPRNPRMQDPPSGYHRHPSVERRSTTPSAERSSGRSDGERSYDRLSGVTTGPGGHSRSNSGAGHHPDWDHLNDHRRQSPGPGGNGHPNGWSSGFEPR